MLPFRESPVHSGSGDFAFPSYPILAQSLPFGSKPVAFGDSATLRLSGSSALTKRHDGSMSCGKESKLGSDPEVSDAKLVHFSVPSKTNGRMVDKLAFEGYRF